MAKTYQKIPGIGAGMNQTKFVLRSYLYTAADHLLIVEKLAYQEKYKRIFFHDIRYVTVRKTYAQLYVAILSGILTLLMALLYYGGIPVYLVALFSSPFLAWFLINLFRGPTCECQISTNVQTIQLPTPRRMNKVAILIAYLRNKTAAYEHGPIPTTVA